MAAEQGVCQTNWVTTGGGGSGVAIAPDGRWALVADTMNHCIRQLWLQTGQVLPLAGTVTTQSDATNFGTRPC
jgi:sugar lactone lactonase YvrE